jgi:hypothetical protein
MNSTLSQNCVIYFGTDGVLPPSQNKWHNFDFVYVYQCTILIANIFNYLLKIIKIVYFKNTRRDKSNNISYANICMYILVEKYGQSWSNE